MKKYAYYLPQFHEIQENNEWWGKGFTEWTNVKKAQKLFKNHKQPKIPLNHNYYSLDEPDTLRWQAELANYYHIDGMIFYHYYFCGRKLLEKPAEMLLNNKDIPMNFFFCWANHNWHRSWAGSKELLLEQKYGKQNEWLQHFEYLLPFFKDQRYLKIENKPVLMFFECEFEEKRQIVDFFNKKCLENGFSGICIIERCLKYDKNSIDNAFEQSTPYTQYIHLREPNSVCYKYINLVKSIPFRIYNKLGKMSHIFNTKYLEKYNGNKLFDIMTNIKIDDKRIIRGLFFEWDNTPRHFQRGYIITPPSKERFIKYMDSLVNEQFLFINAWNEWCEGMMMEPTEENSYKYLEWIKEWSELNENRINRI